MTIASCHIVESIPRACSGAASAMYTGTVAESDEEPCRGAVVVRGEDGGDGGLTIARGEISLTFAPG